MKLKLTLAGLILMSFAAVADDVEEPFDPAEPAAEKVAPAQKSVIAPQQQPAAVAERAPQAVTTPSSSHFYCGTSTEYNIAATLDKHCKTDGTISFTSIAGKEGLFFCCSQK